MTVFSADLSFTPPVYTPSTSEKPGVGVRVGDQEKLPEPKVPVGGSDKYKPKAAAQLRQLLAGFGPLILACVPHDDTGPVVPVVQAPESRGGYEKPEFLPPRSKTAPAPVGTGVAKPEPSRYPTYNGGASGGYHRIMHDFAHPGMWGQTSASQQFKVIGVGVLLGAALLAYETATAAFSFFVVPPEPQNDSVI